MNTGRRKTTPRTAGKAKAAAQGAGTPRQTVLGRLPVPTWNRLHMNESAAADLPAHWEDVDTEFTDLPAGMCERILSPEKAAAYLRKHAPSQPTEKIVAGKTPIAHEQRFATGLGGDLEAQLDAQGHPVHLLEVAAGTRGKEPLLWGIDQEEDGAVASRQIIHVGEDAELVVIMHCTSGAKTRGASALSTRILLDARARMILVRVQRLSDGLLHMDDLGVSLAEEASLKVVRMELGGGRVFTGAHAELPGRDARFEDRTGYYAGEKQELDMTVEAVHRGRGSRSDITYDGVLDGRAKKILRDTIDFRAGSRQAKGEERENVLLLSPEAENRSMPIILCEEEDMEGSHGATVGRLDEEMLFYLTTRGISAEEAARMMVRAKLQAVARHIPHHDTVEEVHARIEELLR